MRGFKITIFGIITASLDVRIANVFFFHAIRVRLHPDFHTQNEILKRDDLNESD